MFRKEFYIAFTLYFIIATSGLTVQENFCYGKLISVFLDKTSKQCCNSPCIGCHTRVIVIKVPDNFIYSIKKHVPGKITLKCPFFFCAKTDYRRKAIVVCSNNNYNTYSTLTKDLTTSQLQVFRC